MNNYILDYKIKYLKYKQKYDLLKQTTQIGGNYANILYIIYNCKNNLITNNHDINDIKEYYELSSQHETTILFQDIDTITSNEYNLIFVIMCEDQLEDFTHNIDQITKLKTYLALNGIIYIKSNNSDLIEQLKILFLDGSFEILELPNNDKRISSLSASVDSEQCYSFKGNREYTESDDKHLVRYYGLSATTPIERWQYSNYNKDGWIDYSQNASQDIDRNINSGFTNFNIMNNGVKVVIDITRKKQHRIDTPQLTRNIRKLIENGSSSSYNPRGYNATFSSHGNKFNTDIMKNTDILLHTNRDYDSNYLIQIALTNLDQNTQDKTNQYSRRVIVENGDWGVIASKYTFMYGQIFAVLNMANGSNFGGGYKSGSSAQEENMMRRTTCSLYKEGTAPNGDKDEYKTWMAEYINGKNGLVYLDTRRDRIRVCFRDTDEYSYRFLTPNKYFPFYELRAAAINNNRNNFTEYECQKRINAQFNTLHKCGVRFVILSAFGCGAFNNPPDIVAKCYKNAIREWGQHFDVIVFAIYTPQHGGASRDSNYPVFYRVLNDLSF